ncbi:MULTISPECIES: TraB/VirB10 family protein [Paraburkholderia]|uniref:TraB/VirB10 family protein n=1 Tax=Paraburkholderia madseniana TaxID=2599607 RepID=A0AAP5BN58_9BURK|nr:MULTISPECIES: TraB/VirB10 family protein [Paraburkholderia]MCX4151035.1 TraB/VirB10 family protein [Paraburkholderia madseniana]MCX4176675.1 TraB/VirB10 family protein [Paraburkholderia madseniana]MDN7153967.1 TraB/VirB10 family protein [Paraburkholderia sp. WS6]MDQ6412849.1 TraB/VirB10 family protein [Paraburkholderia madseniana]MDQ6464666.1 TraB/VirB10 family protein [Paraburkholderia madseniana]
MWESIKAWGADKYKEWKELDAVFRYLMLAIVAVFVPLIIAAHFRQPPAKSIMQSMKTAGPGSAPGQANAQGAALPTTGGATDGWGGQRILPDSPRNQGLETVLAKMDALSADVQKLKGQVGANSGQPVRLPTVGAQFGHSPLPPGSPADAASGTAVATTGNGLGKDLPESVSFDQPGKQPAGRGNGKSADGADAPSDSMAAAPVPSRPLMVSDPIDKNAQDDGSGSRPDLVLPIYTGLEAVMLSGVNARPSGSNNGSSGGAAGSVTAALNVGAPFVSRVKGVAIMPNSWKTSDLENCFIGGSATAVLSAERAYGIADHISCIFKNGDVYEAPIKAYALDVDGTLGIAGKVVNKQGAMLMQAALTGMAAGLGSALAPTAVPSYNSNAGSGSQQSFTVPSPGYLAGTAVGQGVNHAATELSQFYLNFAKETFPVVEVTAGTRVTWILEEDITLKKRVESKGANS